ncbi:MAG: hypothetical protein ACLPHP_23705 [Candidatus Sulfotelmatobacter sp.]
MFDLTARIIKSAPISSALTSNPDLSDPDFTHDLTDKDAWISHAAIVRYPSNIVNAECSLGKPDTPYTDRGDRDT